MADHPIINLGQFPPRSLEDVRLQTQEQLDSCDPEYFRHYPSHPGIVIRHLHDQLTYFSRAVSTEAVRCLVWGRAGDIVHLHKYFAQFSFDCELHAVVDNEDDFSWAEAQTSATVWLETQPEQYCCPPYVSPDHFDCVIVMGMHRATCLDNAPRYLNTQDFATVLAVDSELKYCQRRDGVYYLGGPVWRKK